VGQADLRENIDFFFIQPSILFKERNSCVVFSVSRLDRRRLAQDCQRTGEAEKLIKRNDTAEMLIKIHENTKGELALTMPL